MVSLTVAGAHPGIASVTLVADTVTIVTENKPAASSWVATSGDLVAMKRPAALQAGPFFASAMPLPPTSTVAAETSA